MSERTAIAIAAHPDDIEFTMAGTLLLLGEAGWRTHYLNVSSGSGGSLVHGPIALRRIRRREARAAAALLGAEYHESRADDLEILYTLPLLRWLTGVIRKVQPDVVLTHPPEDYMEDHMTTCRLAVTAAFARGVPNVSTGKKAPPASGDCVVYHAMPMGLCDPLRRAVAPGAFVDTTSVQANKLAALTCHKSQQGWLQASQGMNSYLRTMERMSLAVGRRSHRFRHAEGWWRHSPMGFSTPDADPLRDALGHRYRVNPAFERLTVR
ncbi:MAG: PIG-L family deacetylase [Verrucomicrobia bacterium]|nr:PIG-L family deacetylase [Verrucomicrobiota bacterium]